MLRDLLMSESQNVNIVPKMAKLAYSLDSWHFPLSAFRLISGCCVTIINAPDKFILFDFHVLTIYVRGSTLEDGPTLKELHMYNRHRPNNISIQMKQQELLINIFTIVSNEKTLPYFIQKIYIRALI